MAKVRQRRRRARLNKWVEQLRQDRAILLLCMGIALVFWVPTKMAQTYRTEKKIGIQIELPPKTAFSVAPPQYINVVIEGQGWDLLFDELLNARMKLRFDLRESGQLRLNQSQLRKAVRDRLYSYDLNIVDINYESLNISVEPKKGKWVPVRFTGELTFARNYFLKRPIQLKPDSIWLEGPENQIGLTDWISTKPIKEKQLKASFNRRLELIIPPEFSASSDKVTLSAEIEKFTEKSVFVDVQLPRYLKKVRIFPAQVKVTFLVGLSKFDETSSTDFRIEVDTMPSFSDSESSARLILKKQPDYVRNIRIFPTRIDFLFVE